MCIKYNLINKVDTRVPACCVVGQVQKIHVLIFFLCQTVKLILFQMRLLILHTKCVHKSVVATIGLLLLK